MNEGPNIMYLGPETTLEKLKSYTTSREVCMKAWIMEKLEDERRFNQREGNILKSEVFQKLQQTQLCRWNAGEPSWNERGSSELRERLREVERELSYLQKDRRMDEVDRMGERMAKMERQVAKMEEERALERKEAAERESERKSAMEEERARVRRELEEERARERREMERLVSQMDKERAREKKEMEIVLQQMEEWWVERERMKRQQAAMERALEDMEMWLRERDDSVHLRTAAAITQMEDRFDQMEDRFDQMEDRFDQMEDSLASSRDDGLLKTKLEAFITNMQTMYSQKFQEATDRMDRSFKELTDRCILEGTRATVQKDQGDQQPERLAVDRGNVNRAEVRGGQRRRPRRRQDREEHSLSSVEMSEKSERNERRERSKGRRRERESALALATISETSSTCSAKAGWTSDGGSNNTVNELPVITEEKEKNEKRGFFNKLFKKNKGKKA